MTLAEVIAERVGLDPSAVDRAGSGSRMEERR